MIPPRIMLVILLVATVIVLLAVWTTKTIGGNDD